MAEISVDFRNIVDSKKCAVSSPRQVSLEIGDESPGSASESAIQGFFLDQVSHSDVKNNSNLICGFDKQNDKNFLIHSESFLSTSTCDERPSDKIKTTSNIDFDLLDLLNHAKLEGAPNGSAENFDSTENKCDDTMKIISNVEVSCGLSDLLSTIPPGFSERDGVSVIYEYCQRKDTEDCRTDLLNFDFALNECSDSLSSNNSSLKVEGNLSELLSSIILEDSDIIKVEPTNMGHSKFANNLKMDKEPYVAELSDFLSSINLEDSKENKVNSYNQGNMKIVDTKTESCLADLLSSIDKEKSNKSVLEKKPPVTHFSDLLSSIDVRDSNDSIVGSCNEGNMKVVETQNELCLADLLSSVDIDKSAPTLLNSEPLSFGGSNMFLNSSKGVSDSLNDCAFDVLCFSSNNSCASSYSETENHSPKYSLSKNNLKTDKVLESDSGYNSFDSAHKEFSFFDYSSDNQFSFNTLLTKSDANALKHGDCADGRNINEEISMSDLLTIVSPEFKNPVLATLNKAEKLESNYNKDNSSMHELIESLNIISKNLNPHVIRDNSVECDQKLMNYNCVDEQISKKVQSGMETINFEAGGSLEKPDILIDRPDNINDDDKTASDDEQVHLIDLRECIKSAKHQFTDTSPKKQIKSVENQSVEHLSPNKILFYSDEKSPSDLSKNRTNSYEFIDAVPMEKSRVNAKQTMFSKALACKSKKDQSLLRKVANIKNELLNSIIYRPVFIDCDVPQPIIEPVLQSDRCILSNVGRRSFGQDTPCEWQ